MFNQLNTTYSTYTAINGPISDGWVLSGTNPLLTQERHLELCAEIPSHEFTPDVSGMCSQCYFASNYKDDAFVHPHSFQEELDEDDWRDRLAS